MWSSNACNTNLKFNSDIFKYHAFFCAMHLIVIVIIIFKGNKNKSRPK